MIGTPGHGKDIVYAINTCNKRYIKEKMCMIDTLEPFDCTKIMEAHAMVGESKSSWTITYKKLLEDNIRVHGVKSENKYSKRKTEKKMKKELIIYNI